MKETLDCIFPAGCCHALRTILTASLVEAPPRHRLLLPRPPGTSPSFCPVALHTAHPLHSWSRPPRRRAPAVSLLHRRREALPHTPHHGPLTRPSSPADGGILQRGLRPTRQSALRLSGHQWLKWHKMGNLVPIDIRDTGRGAIDPARFPLRVALFPPEGLLNQSSRLRPASCRSGEPNRSSPCQAAPAGAPTAGDTTAPPAWHRAPATGARPAHARTDSFKGSLTFLPGHVAARSLYVASEPSIGFLTCCLLNRAGHESSS